MPFEFSDIALFLVSFAACTYCALLSRRLKALQNTKNGLGATIQAMSDSVAAVSTARVDTQRQAESLASKLTSVMQDAEQTARKLEELRHALEIKDRETSRRIQAADADIKATMRDALAQSSETVAELTHLTKRLEAVADRATSRFDSSDYLFEDEDGAPPRKVFAGHGQE